MRKMVIKRPIMNPRANIIPKTLTMLPGHEDNGYH